MMRKTWGIVAAAAAAVLAWQAAATRAQPAGGSGGPPGGGFAVVDVIRIFDDCDQIRDLNSLLREAKDAFDKESESRQKALAQREVELGAFSPNSPDYAPRRAEFVRLSYEFNAWMQVHRAEMQRDHFNWTRAVYDECLRAVRLVAEERGFRAVLQKRDFKPELIADESIETLRQMIHGRSVVWSDDSTDLTETVIKRMNAHYKERGGRTKLRESFKGGG